MRENERRERERANEMSVWRKASPFPPVHSTSLDFSPSHPISLSLSRLPRRQAERLKAAKNEPRAREESDKKLDKVKHFISRAVCITHSGAGVAVVVFAPDKYLGGGGKR